MAMMANGEHPFAAAYRTSSDLPLAVKDNIEAMQQAVFIYKSVIDWTDILDPVPLIRFTFELFNGLVLPVNIGQGLSGFIRSGQITFSRRPDCHAKIEHLETAQTASLVLTQHLSTSEAAALLRMGKAGEQINFEFSDMEITVASDVYDGGRSHRCPLRRLTGVSGKIPDDILARMPSNSGREALEQ